MLPQIIDIPRIETRFHIKLGISGLFSVHKGKRSEGGILNLKFMFNNFSYAFGPVGKCNKIYYKMLSD